MFSGRYVRPFSRLNLSAIACLSSGKQGVGVYLVTPLSSAALAASLMKAGVSKSGSPAPKPTTSTPAFFSALALALTARVIESATNLTRSASEIICISIHFVRAENRIDPKPERQMRPTSAQKSGAGYSPAPLLIPRVSPPATLGPRHSPLMYRLRGQQETQASEAR